jgi:hypothetical protein
MVEYGFTMSFQEQAEIGTSFRLRGMRTILGNGQLSSIVFSGRSSWVKLKEIVLIATTGSTLSGSKSPFVTEIQKTERAKVPVLAMPR